jgi:hypothetical protein
VAGTCIFGCTTDADCAATQACVANRCMAEGCVDADGDGFCADVDCDDHDAAVHPGAAEVCGDGLDNDCDGVVDNGCGVTCAADTDCAANEVCVGGVCTADGVTCAAETDCAANEVCVGGVCTAEGVTCAAGQALCGSFCVDLATDPHNCGACGFTCGAGSVCGAGVCGVPCNAAGDCPQGHTCTSAGVCS